jgi:hypothetical protein
MVVKMSETFIGLLIIVVVFGFMLIILYGSALILTEHFWIGVLLLLFLYPIFFIWAFFRGLTGK